MGDGSRRQAFADRWRGAHPASDTVVRVITVGELVGPDCVRERVQCVAVALEEAAAGEREAVLSVLSCRGWELDPMASVGILSNGEELASREDVVRWLDPDGVFREKGCTPAQEDFALEDVFCGGLWLMMRCGRIRDAVEMVRRSDQPWRELSLLELKHWNLQEPNWHQSKVQRIKRWNWKRACLKLASVDSESISNWEKAVYGLLAGHPEFSDKLCRSVLDILWAHLCCYYENLADWVSSPTCSAHLIPV